MATGLLHLHATWAQNSDSNSGDSKPQGWPMESESGFGADVSETNKRRRVNPPLPHWRDGAQPPHPPFQGAKMFKGCRGQGLHLGAPHACAAMKLNKTRPAPCANPHDPAQPSTPFTPVHSPTTHCHRLQSRTTLCPTLCNPLEASTATATPGNQPQRSAALNDSSTLYSPRQFSTTLCNTLWSSTIFHNLSQALATPKVLQGYEPPGPWGLGWR